MKKKNSAFPFHAFMRNRIGRKHARNAHRIRKIIDVMKILAKA